MYRIICDNQLVYEPGSLDFSIIEGKVSLGVNTAGSLVFKISPDNPMYGRIFLMKSIVELYDDGRLVFRGRPYAPSLNLFRHDRIECEGELAFFNDTYQEPFDFHGTVSDLFRRMVLFHNTQVSEEKQFKVGVCNVENDTATGTISRSSESYLNTWQFIEDKFIESGLGGYLHVRHEEDGNYIDYLKDLNYYNPTQEITQCINLIDASKETSSGGLATVVIPLGAKIEDAEGQQTKQRLTIADVNGGNIHIEDENGVENYGRIVKIVVHDDITEATNLYSAGEKDLADAVGVITAIKIRAADLKRAGYSVDPFMLGTYVKVNVKNLNIDGVMMPIKKLVIDLLHPENNEIEVGDEHRSLTRDTLVSNKASENFVIQIQNETINNLLNKINQLQETLNGSITSSASGLRTEFTRTLSDQDDKIEELSSTLTQTAQGITATINQFKSDYGDYVSGSDAQFNEFYKYFSFTSNGLEIKTNDSKLRLVIDNDEIVLYYYNKPVSWWSTNMQRANSVASDAIFYAYAGSFVDRLGLGKFEFKVRENGNLSLTRTKKSIKIIGDDGEWKTV